MKAVKIEWIDSCSSNTEWALLSEFQGDIEPIHIVSYGIVVQETEYCVTIAQNYGIDPEQVSNLMTIPKGCIKQMIEL